MDKMSSDNLTSKEQKYSWVREKFPEWDPVFGSHVKRIGLLRAGIGGIPMYFSLLFFALFHLVGLFILSGLILQPLLGLKKLKFKNYIVIDRHKITDLSWSDRFNCVYCGYANGLTTFADARLDQLELWEGELNLFKKMILSLSVILYIPFSLVLKLQTTVVYDLIVSRLLGLHRLSTKDALLEVESSNRYVNKNTSLIYKILRGQRVFYLKVSNSLEQIESAFCPIKHLDERPEVVYPKHHENFLGRHEIKEIMEVLQRDGTVSSRKPYW